MFGSIDFINGVECFILRSISVQLAHKVAQTTLSIPRRVTERVFLGSDSFKNKENNLQIRKRFSQRFLELKTNSFSQNCLCFVGKLWGAFYKHSTPVSFFCIASSFPYCFKSSQLIKVYPFN